MKILISSPAFLPQLGGLEIHVAQLAEGLTCAGHQVVVLTRTRGQAPEKSAFAVERNPSPIEQVRFMRWCEVFYQANLSLRNAWPLLLCRRPWVVSHHSWYCRSDGHVALADRLKRFLLRFTDGSLAVSKAMAADLDTRSEVIPNSYRADSFRVMADVARDRDLVFVGRLVSDKGVDILLRALILLRDQSWTPSLTIIGTGPEDAALREQVAHLGLHTQVEFTGSLTGQDLVETLNRHSILVVPSRYAEPFGIVALEGIACGCVVAGSDKGGLPEAIGPCGLTFPNGDEQALARVLTELRDPERRRGLLAMAPMHLESHDPAGHVVRFIGVFERAVRNRARARPRANR